MQIMLASLPLKSNLEINKEKGNSTLNITLASRVTSFVKQCLIAIQNGIVHFDDTAEHFNS